MYSCSFYFVSNKANESDLFPYNIVIAERIYTLEH